MAGVSSLSGPMVRLEAQYRPTSSTSLFAFGEWNRTEPLAGIGWRWEF